VLDVDALQQLLDHKAIADLAVAYTWALDRREYENLRQVFTADGVADYAGQVFDGVDAIIAKVDSALTRLDASQHLVGNHQVTLAPDGATATARCYFQAQHVKRGTAGGDNFVIAGRYDDQLVRTADGWRIAHRTLSTDWVEGNPAVVGRA
jgi:hypothetical protein